MTTITDAFELPRPEDIRAMGFVVKLRELDSNSEEVQQLLADVPNEVTLRCDRPRDLAEVMLRHDVAHSLRCDDGRLICRGKNGTVDNIRNGRPRVCHRGAVL